MSTPCSEVMLQLLFSSFQDQILLVQEGLLSSDQSINYSIIKLQHLPDIKNSFISFLRSHSSFFYTTEIYHPTG